ncbi:MAG: DUF2905 domain-containing protein [Anaerolineales bacterium]|jgi:hypothetical protein
MSAESIARILIIIGAVLLLAGGVILVFARLGLPLGRLPGDIRIQGQNVTCLIPLASSILLSVLLTILINIIVRFFNR